MTPARWQHIKRLAGDALELEPAQRATFLQNACGDDSTMRDEVESLLAGSSDFPAGPRPETFRYRVSTFVRRHRLGVAAATLVLLALVGRLGVAAWQAHVARAERSKAVQRLGELRELSGVVLFDDHDPLAAPPASAEVRQRLVQDALRYLDRLAEHADGDRALLRELAHGYEKVAGWQGGALRTPSGVVLSASDSDESVAAAVTSHQKAIATREQVLQLGGNDPSDLEALAYSYVLLAEVYLLSGPPEKAFEFFQKASPLAESLLAADAAKESRRVLSSTIYAALAKAPGSSGGAQLGDTRTAMAYLRGALKLQEGLVADFPNNIGYQQKLAATYHALALVYSAIGEHEEQLELNRKGLAVTRTLVAAQPDSALHQRELAVQLETIASVFVQLKDVSQALSHFREALSLYERLKANGQLSDADRAKPDELAREIANCEAAVLAKGKPAP